MKKHKIEKSEPENYRLPENIPKVPKFRCVVADPPWSCNQQSNSGRYGGAIKHYDLMSLERIKNMPVKDLVADDAMLWLWSQNGNIDEALEVIKAWGFRYISTYVWVKPRLGMGNYIRNSTEPCLFAVRGHIKPLNRNQINWTLSYPTKHSEKPRGFISDVENVSPGPYLELFCRKRPASSNKWYCWGNETEGGADIFIPGYPVPYYSWEKDVPKVRPEETAGTEEPDAGGEVK